VSVGRVMKRKRLLLAVLACACCVGAAVYFLRPLPQLNITLERRPRLGTDESRPIQGSHVGKTREELIAEFGEPALEGPWQIGSPRQEVFEKYKGLRTLEWRWPSGKFLASVYPVDGQWMCFNSCWVPYGWVID
jgi:hypothetical protein